MEVKERNREIFEDNPRPFCFPKTSIQLEEDNKEQKDMIKAKIRWTQSLVFHILMRNPELRFVENREMLIKKVKEYGADTMKLNPDSIKAETITRTWRKMVEDGIIPKEAVSDIAEEAHRDYWK